MSLLKTFKNKQFNFIFWATSLSMIGSVALNFAFQAHILKMTNSESLLGLNNAVFYAATLISLIIGGPLGDRFSKKNLMFWSETLCVGVSFFMLTTSNIYALIGLKGLLGFLSAILIPLRQSYIKLNFDEEVVPGMISLIAISTQVAYLMGPMLGTWAFEMTGEWTWMVYLDLASFVLGAFFISMLARDSLSQENEKIEFKIFRQFKEGLEYSLKTFKIKFIVIQNLYHDFYNGYLLALLLPFVKNHLGLGESHLGACFLGYGLGSIIGSTIGDKIVAKNRLYLSYKQFVLVEGMIGLAWMSTTNQYMSIALMGLWGVSASIVYLLKTNVFMRNAQAHNMSRVMSMNEITRSVGSVLGSLFLFGIGNWASAVEILTVSAAACLVFDGVYLFSPLGHRFQKTENNRLPPVPGRLHY